MRVDSTGSDSTQTENVNSVSRLCLCRLKLVMKLLKCTACKSTLYCSKTCHVSHYSEHKTLCKAILSLQEIERNKTFQKFDCSFVNSVHNKQHYKLVRIVGHKPLVQFSLEGRNFEGLWDTGSMVSWFDSQFMNRNFPDVKIESVAEFVGEGEPLSLKAANNSDMEIC